MPPIADSSLTSLYDFIETTYGVTPTGTYKSRRFISETLGQDKETVQSEEVIADRRPPNNIQVGSSASGEITSELTGGNNALNENTWDLYWRMGIGASGYTTSVSTVLTGAGNITVANAADPDDLTLTIGASVTPTTWPATFTAGELVQFIGFTGSLLPMNTVFKIKSGANTAVLTVTAGIRLASSPLNQVANSGSGPGIVALTLSSATDGSTFLSITSERAYSLANEFALINGLVMSGFRVEIRPKQPARVTWRFLGAQEVSTTVTAASAVTAPATSRRSFSPVTDLATFALDEDGHSFFLNSFTLDVANGAYLQDERAGNLGAIGVGLGTFAVTGSYEAYYENAAVFGQYTGFTSKELIVALRNVDGDAWGVILPRINWTDGRRSTPGKDQPVLGRVDFRAAKGPAFLIKIAKL